jgi:p-hydroxybenzoate 3-monooxygenase
VAEPMRFGTLFLAGDAAHIVPPTGAKGLNLAAADVGLLSRALVEYFVESPRRDRQLFASLPQAGMEGGAVLMVDDLDAASVPETGRFGRKIQLAELDYLVGSTAASTALAENYVGLPLEA